MGVHYSIGPTRRPETDDSGPALRRLRLFSEVPPERREVADHAHNIDVYNDADRMHFSEEVLRGAGKVFWRRAHHERGLDAL